MYCQHIRKQKVWKFQQASQGDCWHQATLRSLSDFLLRYLEIARRLPSKQCGAPCEGTHCDRDDHILCRIRRIRASFAEHVQVAFLQALSLWNESWFGWSRAMARAIGQRKRQSFPAHSQPLRRNRWRTGCKLPDHAGL